MSRNSALHKSFTLLFIMSVTVAFAGYTSLASAQHVTDGLELYIPFDADTCSGDACDDIAGNHDAVFNFPIKHVPGQVNEAVEFNSENGHFAETNLLINSNEFESLTMEAWANPYMEHEAFGAMMGGDDGGWDRGYGYRKDLWEIQVGKGGDWQPGPEAVFNTWQHTVVIYTPDLVIFYWNGDRYEFDEADPTESTQPFMIGDDIPCGPDCTFPGAVDEVRIYGRELTDAEVQQNYQGGTAVESTGKIAVSWGEIKTLR